MGKHWQVSATLYMSSEHNKCLCFMYYRNSHFHRIFVVAQFIIIVVQSAMYALDIYSPNHLTDQYLNKTRLWDLAWNV
jgi:hypothetical protein